MINSNIILSMRWEIFFSISVRLRWGISLRIIAMMPPPEAFLSARCILNFGTEKCVIGNESSILVSLKKNMSELLFLRISETSENLFLIPLMLRWYTIKFLACLARNIFNSSRNPPCSLSDIVPKRLHHGYRHYCGHSDSTECTMIA